MRQRCLNCFLDTLDQKTITTKKKTNFPHEKVFVIFREKMITSFLTCDFLKFYKSYKKNKTKTNDIFWILRKVWARHMCLSCKNIDLKIWPDLDLTLTRTPSKVRLDVVIGSNDCHHRYLLAKLPRKHVSHSMFVTFIYSDLSWPEHDLDLFKYAFHTHAVSFVDIYPALWVSVSSLHPV